MKTPGQDPAVIAWHIALAPQPRRAKTGRHWWREYVTDIHQCAMQAWFLAAEAASNGWQTELDEYAAEHPRPRFKDALIQLSQGRMSPERLDDLAGAA